MTPSKTSILTLTFLVSCALAGCKEKPAEASSASASSAAAESGLAQVGKPAPPFEAVAHDGTKVSLAGLAGKAVVLYFYPKDDTPGCTIEAQELRDRHADIQNAKAVVLGVSTDDNDSHKAFAEKHNLPFLLLPDTDKAIAKAYGVPVTLGYAKRITFVIDPKGNVAKVFSDVKPKGHAEEIMSVLATLGV